MSVDKYAKIALIIEENKELKKAIANNDRNILNRNFVDAVRDAEKRQRYKDR